MPGEQRFPPQHQDRQPGLESQMRPRPKSTDRKYRPAGKLEGKVAVVTGGDSGIGRAVAVHYAMEGADVAVLYFNEHDDARETKRLVEKEGRRCVLKAGDLGDPAVCERIAEEVVDELGGVDVLVNNAAEQHYAESLEDIPPEQVARTFRTNVFAFFHLTRALLPHLGKGATIINTTSVTAFHGSARLLDYSATKGAIVAFTRSLSQQLLDKGIRVNAVAPGPVWTPLIPSSFPEEDVAKFGADYPMKRAAQPEEIAPTYVFLACDDSSYYTGQVLHPNGGEIVGS